MTVHVDSTGKSLPPLEVPSAEKLRVLGDMLFLAFRSERHQKMSVATLRAHLEPAVELGQFRVFRFDDVPRAYFTWGWLDTTAEAKLVGGEALAPAEWQSGDNLWLVDLVAPYRGLTASLVRWIMVRGNFAERDFYFRRVEGTNQTRRIVHIDFERDRLSRILSDADFLQS